MDLKDDHVCNCSSGLEFSEGSIPVTERYVMTAQEVASYLRISQATVYKLARSGEIPAVRLGRSWRFRRDLLEKWLESEWETQEEGDTSE